MARLIDESEGVTDTLFTAAEREFCRGKRRSADHMAGRFAAKEAVLKALGTGIGQRMRWTDVEVLKGRRGRPFIKLHGEVASWAKERGLADLDVTIAHSAGIAVAHALAVWPDLDDAGDPRERPFALSPD